MMTSLGWAILVVGLALSADVGWAEYRDWRSRRDAARRGTTLTQKFGLRPPVRAASALMDHAKKAQ